MNRAKSGKKKQRDLLHTLCQRTTTTYSGILFITANIWVVYTFAYKEIWLPKTAPIHISSKIDLLDAGEKRINKKKFKAVKATFEITNNNKRRAVLLHSVYVVWAHRINWSVDKNFIKTANDHFVNYDPDRDINLRKFGDEGTNDIVATGSIYRNWLLEPGESSQRSVLIYVPKEKYDFIEVKVHYPVVNEENVATGKWEINNDNSLQFYLFKKRKGDDLEQVDLTGSNTKDKAFIKKIDYAPYEEYQWLSLWEQVPGIFKKVDSKAQQQNPADAK